MATLHAFNRFLVVLVSLALIAASVVMLLVVTSAVDTGTLAPSGWFREQYRHLADLTGTDQTIATVAMIAAIAAGTLLFFFELLPRPTRVRSMRFRDPNGNWITMPAETVSAIADQAAMRVPGVIHAASTVRPGDDGAILQTHVLLKNDSSVVSASGGLNDEIKTAMKERAGMKVSSLQLQLEVSPPEKTEEPRPGWFHSGQRGQKVGGSR